MKPPRNTDQSGKPPAGAADEQAEEAGAQRQQSGATLRAKARPEENSRTPGEGVKPDGVRSRFLPASEKVRKPVRKTPATASAGAPRGSSREDVRSPRGSTVQTARRDATQDAERRRPADSAGVPGPRRDKREKPAASGRGPATESSARPRRDRPSPAAPRAGRTASEGRAAPLAPRVPARPASETTQSRARRVSQEEPSDVAVTGVRLSKIMAERGMCSRREADAIIERGWVFVDGQRVSELGIRIDPNAEITLAAQAKRQQAEQVTILLHKPIGYVSGQPEPGFEPAVSLIGADNQFDSKDAQRFHASHLKGLAPAGRLDIDSTGLLVLTQNGRVARQLIGEDSKVEKEYLVRVEGRLDEGGLALLSHGLELDGRKLRPAKVEWLNEDQLRFVLREGRKRQIRRMCELVGLKVVGLKRVRIGGVRLGDLPLGQWRFLREDESF